MNLREIGQKVKQRRIALGLSQDGLAKLCGLSRSTIHHLEAGSLKDLGATKLFSLDNFNFKESNRDKCPEELQMIENTSKAM